MKSENDGIEYLSSILYEYNFKKEEGKSYIKYYNEFNQDECIIFDLIGKYVTVSETIELDIRLLYAIKEILHIIYQKINIF